jgi:hypothetical protein
VEGVGGGCRLVERVDWWNVLAEGVDWRRMLMAFVWFCLLFWPVRIFGVLDLLNTRLDDQLSLKVAFSTSESRSTQIITGQ